MNVADLSRNNLDSSSSPYLLQHVSNPVWWQEWSRDLISHALSVNKPVLVSVGYATCHWCHVMASEAFSDTATAAYLNDHFICIKVDREQRPDIDQFMMDFINSRNGRGGWPLNVFLTPTLKPVFALTYAPAVTGSSMYSFLSVASQVFAFIKENGSDISEFSPVETTPPVASESNLAETLTSYYDNTNGGFGTGQKFPSHTTLLYLLYNLAVNDSASIKEMCIKTLDAMRLRGLHDHLQGGIFRYCVDSEWTIPHFEKMLYDQAMALWTYSLAYRVLGRDEYRIMADSIIKCLSESFEINGFYISAHDADTFHEEGATYLWSFDELKNCLEPDEFSIFRKTYSISEEGNFEGSNHLIRLNDIPLTDIERKLLFIRKGRRQPDPDNKILSGINALVAIALIQAARALDKPEYEAKASALTEGIITRFWDGRSLGHSYYNDTLQKQGFLTDAATLLTAISMLYENDSVWEKKMNEIADYVRSFREDKKWIESDSGDFRRIYAAWFDHPSPSGASMAEFALTRVNLQRGQDTSFMDYLQPFQSDFFNIAAMAGNGLFHIITCPDPVNWKNMPVNSIRLKGDILQDCFMGICTIPD